MDSNFHITLQLINGLKKGKDKIKSYLYPFEILYIIIYKEVLLWLQF